MRLSDEERACIVRAVRETSGASAVVRLLGSLTRDDLKGGDIDLHVVAPGSAADLHHALDLLARLSEALGNRKIDVVVHAAGDAPRAIAEIAVRDGVML